LELGLLLVCGFDLALSTKRSDPAECGGEFFEAGENCGISAKGGGVGLVDTTKDTEYAGAAAERAGHEEGKIFVELWARKAQSIMGQAPEVRTQRAGISLWRAATTRLCAQAEESQKSGINRRYN